MAKNYTEQMVLEAVAESDGIVSNVAARLRCDWKIARKYIDKWESTKEAFEAESEQLTELAFSVMKQKVREGERWAVERVLDSKAAKDGFAPAQKVELTGADGGPVQSVTKIIFQDSEEKESEE